MAPDQVIVLCGPYGSGKTEIAINLAVWLAGERGAGGGVWLADLDLVTPYFRIRDVRECLDRTGVRVVVPASPWGEADLPILPPGLSGLLRGGGPGVVDVGGGEAGARVLGSLSPFLGGRHRLWLVLNPYRPGGESPERLAAIAGRVLSGARLGSSGVVSNPHLGEETTAEAVLRGHAVVEGAAGLLGLPVVMVAVLEDMAPAVENKLGRRVFAMRRYLRPPWEGW